MIADDPRRRSQTIADDRKQDANTGTPTPPPSPFIPISLRDGYVIRDHTGNCDLITSLSCGNTEMVSDSRLVLKNIQCTNGFSLQIKGENVRIKTSVLSMRYAS